MDRAQKKAAALATRLLVGAAQTYRKVRDRIR